MKTNDAEYEAKVAAHKLQIMLWDRIIAQEETRKMLQEKKRKPLIRWPWSK